MNARIIGFVPARMASSRFPGKPLHPILGRPMIEHVICRSTLFKRWDGLFLATCDAEIAELCRRKQWPFVMTASTHIRCLDRVTEAAIKCGIPLDDRDIIVCVQGDEPLVHPDMIAATVQPLEQDERVPCTVLAMEIQSDEQFRNPDTVKIIHDRNGDVLYTSRSPVPYCSTLHPEIGARRISGILAFRWSFLQYFTSLPESPLERVESCDSNRICDNGHRQRIAPYPYRPTFGVDRPSDVLQVESAMLADPLHGKY